MTTGIITPDKLTLEQRKRAEYYLELAQIEGTFVGVIAGHMYWDVQPLVLQGHILTIVRVSDPGLSLNKARYTELEKLGERLLSFPNKYQIIAAGERGGEIWCHRPYYQKTLAEIVADEEGFAGLNPERLARYLIERIAEWKRDGLVHGHIVPENLGIENNELKVMDYGFCVSSPDLAGQAKQIAPEVLDQQPLTHAVDIYGLGVTLPSLLGEEHASIFEKMSAENPADRPELDEVIKEIWPEKLTFVGVTEVEEEEGELEEEEETHHGDTEEEEEPEVEDVEEALEWLYGTSSLGPQMVDQIKERLLADLEEEKVEEPLVEEEVAEELVEEIVEIEEEEEEEDVQEEVHHGDTEKEEKVQKQGVSWGWVVVLLVVFYGYQNQDTVLRYINAYIPITDSTPYERYWSSNIPSKMQEVALAAVIDGNQQAELVIIEDALGGSNRPNVLSKFIRIAFSPDWEQQLSAKDREIALKLGLAELVASEVQSLPPISEAHPGVLLAAVSRMRLRDPADQVAEIPVSRMASLPRPFGQAFTMLDQIGVSYFEDPAARALCQILTGSTSREVLEIFLQSQDDTIVAAGKLQILLFISQWEKRIPELTYNVLRRGKGVLSRMIKWFDGKQLADWSNVSFRDKLALAVGNMPERELPVQNYASLLKFPMPLTTQSAVSSLLGKNLPGLNEEMLLFLASQESNLTRDQTVLLVTALTLTGEEQYSLLSKWIQTRPDPNSVVLLIARSVDIPGLDYLGLESARYLKDQSWSASIETLRELLDHEELLVRALAYSKLDASRPIEREVLKEQLSNEPNERMLEEIRFKLSTDLE